MENNNQPSASVLKPKNIFVGALIFIVFLTGIYFWNTYSSKNNLEKFAREQLTAKKYSLVELKILESHNATKTKKATGKVEFTVKDIDGKIFEGKAEITSKTHWLIFNENEFIMTEIHQQK